MLPDWACKVCMECEMDRVQSIMLGTCKQRHKQTTEQIFRSQIICLFLPPYPFFIHSSTISHLLVVERDSCCHLPRPHGRKRTQSSRSFSSAV